jgi:hypothetical protein
VREPTEVQAVKSYCVTIFIAGDYATALDICQKYCDEIGLCVTVEQTVYVYTNGQEAGVRVGLINYARFPSEPLDMHLKAEALAERLLEGLNQQSYTIFTPEFSRWVSYREQD